MLYWPRGKDAVKGAVKQAALRRSDSDSSGPAHRRQGKRYSRAECNVEGLAKTDRENGGIKRKRFQITHVSSPCLLLDVVAVCCNKAS